MEASDSLQQKKIKFFCPILDTSTYIKTYVLYTISTEKHEPKEPAIHYGTFQHNDNAEPVRPRFTDRGKHGNAKSDSLVIYNEIYYDKKTRYADL